jgi:hypothetical protein
MRRRPAGLPPTRCTATAKRTGEPCQQWAVVGTVVCWHHNGANGRVKANGDMRITLAQLLAQDPRSPWEVVLDATHTLDCLMRDAKVDLQAGEPVSVDQLDRLINLSQTAHHLAQTAIQTKAAEHIVQTYVDQGNRLAGLITEVVDRLALTVEWRIFALRVVHHLLQLEAGEQSEEPTPPDDPLVQETVTGVTIVDSRHAIEGTRSSVPSADYIASLDDADLRQLGEMVADQLDQRRIYD